jgi:hypothetical protein
MKRGVGSEEQGRRGLGDLAASSYFTRKPHCDSDSDKNSGRADDFDVLRASLLNEQV